MSAPMNVQEAVAQLHLRWDGDPYDFQATRRAFIEVTAGVGVLSLPAGPPGPKGLDGDPGPGLAPDVVIDYPTDALALEALQDDLGPGDRGYMVLNDATKTGFFWNGQEWMPVADVVGLQGPQGPPVGISIGTVQTSPSGGTAAVVVDPASTPTNKILNFTLPRGGQGAVGLGAKGDPGDALSAADDVQWPPGGPADGQVMVWDSGINKARWSTLNTGSVGPFSAGPDQFTAINDGSWPEEYKIVCQIHVPAMPFAWRPRVSAYCDVMVTGFSARVDLEARLGSASGPCVGRGAGSMITSFLSNYTPRTLVPTFEGPINPDNNASSVPADTEVTLFLVLRRIDTVSTFGVQSRKDRASFAVWCDPLNGSL